VGEGEAKIEPEGAASRGRLILSGDCGACRLAPGLLAETGVPTRASIAYAASSGPSSALAGPCALRS
jgi:hypothetical protein